MEGPPYEASNNGEVSERSAQIIKYSPYKAWSELSSTWFDLRVFYVRASNFQADKSIPEFLTLSHIPLSHDTLLEVNGVRSGMYSDGLLSSVLRRDRVDKKSEEATFVSTASIRFTGSIKFEVYDKDDIILSGILEMSGRNGFVGESKSNNMRWSMSCETEITTNCGFLKGKDPELRSPTIEVYVAGCFSGTPIILTETLQLNFRKKHNNNYNRKCKLVAIPEYETSTESPDAVASGLDLQVEEHISFKSENEEVYDGRYCQRRYMDGEDGELTWFNAGVRVGVGIGLGVCLGIGLGVGLLVRTYHATTRNLKRHLI